MGSKISVAVTFYLKFILLDDVLYLLKTISEEIFLANGLVGRMCNALFQIGVWPNIGFRLIFNWQIYGTIIPL